MIDCSPGQCWHNHLRATVWAGFVGSHCCNGDISVQGVEALYLWDGAFIVLISNSKRLTFCVLCHLTKPHDKLSHRNRIFHKRYYAEFMTCELSVVSRAAVGGTSMSHEHNSLSGIFVHFCYGDNSPRGRLALILALDMTTASVASQHDFQIKWPSSSHVSRIVQCEKMPACTSSSAMRTEWLSCGESSWKQNDPDCAMESVTFYTWNTCSTARTWWYLTWKFTGARNVLSCFVSKE